MKKLLFILTLLPYFSVSYCEECKTPGSCTAAECAKVKYQCHNPETGQAISPAKECRKCLWKGRCVTEHELWDDNDSYSCSGPDGAWPRHKCPAAGGEAVC